jgi:hypothetical protein
MSGIEITIGAAFIIIALASQFILWKRAKDNTMRRILAWLAWSFGYIGGCAVATDIGATTGITTVGAFVASIIMLIVIMVDIRDKRPDWPAFILIILVPAFLNLVGGWLGDLFGLLLLPGSIAASGLATAIGA